MVQLVEDNHHGPEAVGQVLDRLPSPFLPGQSVGIKAHWGEKGNRGYLRPDYVGEVVRWCRAQGLRPFVFDTTVLYFGGRRTAEESLKTAAEHGFTEQALGCPILIGDGMDGRDVVDLPGFRHFPTVQAAAVCQKADGFIIFSHFKGHLESGFGGAIKNLSMGFASRAQKQRIHADAHPVRNAAKCDRCGLCVRICPAGAARLSEAGTPVYDLKRCIGCSQCIALCPKMALKVFWNTDETLFQERLVETAGAVWGAIGGRSLVVNALIGIAAECDCLPGKHRIIAPDWGFVGATHPVAADAASLERIGTDPFERAHPGLPWRRQFAYAREIGFAPAEG